MRLGPLKLLLRHISVLRYIEPLLTRAAACPDRNPIPASPKPPETAIQVFTIYIDVYAWANEGVVIYLVAKTKL